MTFFFHATFDTMSPNDIEIYLAFGNMKLNFRTLDLEVDFGDLSQLLYFILLFLIIPSIESSLEKALFEKEVKCLRGAINE